jgi:dTDP-3,4-didehydro-2,6-dideoxy-alpha-D-glucose 3-reductase
MNTLNIAVWTVGEHARRNILPAINKSKGVDLVGIFTRNKDVLASQSKQYGCHAYKSSDELLLDSNVKVVYISSPNALHYEQVEQCLLNNKHVIVEKSALSSLEETKEIVNLAKSKDLVVMEAFMFLYHRQFSDLKELIKSEKYGKVLFMEASFGFPHLSKDDIRYSKQLAGGALNDAGAYTVCAILNLLGSNSELIFSSVSDDGNHEVDTSGLAIFRNKNIKAICKWIMGASYKNEIRVWCEYGHIVIDRAFSKSEDYATKIQVFHNGVIVEEFTPGVDNHFINMIEYFRDNILLTPNSEQDYDLMPQSRIMQKIRSNSNMAKGSHKNNS